MSVVSSLGPIVKRIRENITGAILTFGAITDGQYLKRSGSTIVSDSGASVVVSGGAILPIDANAVAAVGSGDLFAGTSLDGGWSDLQTTAWSTTDRSVDGYLIAKNSGSTSGLDRGKKRSFSPAGDFEVWTKIPWATMVADFHWTGLFVGATDPSDAAGGNRLQYFLIRNTKIALKAAKIASGVETVVPGISSVGIDDPTLLPEANRNSAVQPFPAWLRIKRVGSTISFGICWDGVEFIDLTSTTTIAFTVNTIGLLHASNSDTRKTRAVFQYIATTG